MLTIKIMGGGNGLEKKHCSPKGSYTVFVIVSFTVWNHPMFSKHLNTNINR